MRRLSRFASLLLTSGLACAAGATGSIRLSSYPALSVADGRSTVTITAEVRNSAGAKVPDGTVVRFSASVGTFREWDAATSAGIARAVLVAPSIAGVSKVTASAASVGIVSTLDVEFVKDRSMLASAHQFIEISSPEYLVYSPDVRIVSATAAERGAVLKYRDIRIEASDMQFDINAMSAVAVDAKLTVGGESIECQRLRYYLARRKGVAIAAVQGKPGGYQLTAAQAAVSESGVSPKEFEFADVGVAASSVHAERIIVFPNREVQFHRARLFVGATQVMSMPLYALRFNTQAGLFSEQVVGFANGGLQVNYPYYLQLSTSQTSVFRLRSGQNYGRGIGASRGMFLDWENTYLAGDSAEGSLMLGGIGRRDMGLSWRHTQRFDDRTRASAMLDFPSFRSMYGGITASRSFNGYSVNLSANSTRSLRGTEFESRRVDLSVETDMRPVGGLPVTQSFGLTANSSRASFGPTRSAQEGYGVRSRWLLLPQGLWDGANLTASLTASQLWGAKAGGLGILGTTSVTTSLGSGSSLQLTYDYAHDAFQSALTGRHRASGQFFIDAGGFSLSLFGGKSLDLDSANLFADTSWQLNKLWRLAGSFSVDRYLGSTVADQTFILGYRLGLREIALTYSTTTKKFGFELLNAPIR